MEEFDAEELPGDWARSAGEAARGDERSLGTTSEEKGV